MCGQKRNEIMGGWRKLHNKEFHDLYSSPSIIRMIKWRKRKWAGRACSINGGAEKYKYVIFE
jgi:hypothetical protein